MQYIEVTMWGWFGLGHLFGGSFRLLLLGAAIVAIVVGTRYGFGRGRAGRRDDSSLEILKRRYASGEISKEEFEQKKSDLES